MLSINTNLPSLIAQNSLKTSTKNLNTAIERMTTGFKINHASDNAANYSIVTNMNTKLSAYQVAEDNVAMGLDLITTASDSLDLINDKLVRLRALAEQAANGTYGEQSLRAINSEANALVDEIKRSYANTEYNGIKVFGESGGSFIEEVKPRDTSSMTKLSSIAPDQEITSGTYSISTASELAQLATMTNDGKVTGGEFVLANNIDLSSYSTGEGWTPIGDPAHAFQGTFDGNGFVVSNLYINRPDGRAQGLFGYSKGKLKNIGVENVDVASSHSIGGLVGRNRGTVTNSYVIGNITGNDERASAIGGLIGNNRGTVTNSYAEGTIKGRVYVGGLIGDDSSGIISNSYATGRVVAEESLGGLVGSTDTTTITNSYATATVTGTVNVGGLVGIFDYYGVTITNCYATGTVMGDRITGGLVGDTSGLVGDNAFSITNSYYDQETCAQNDTGKGIGITTAELNKLLSDGTLPDFGLKTTCKPQNTTFQVGINSDSASQITLDTAFGLNVSALRGIGIGSADYLSQIDNMINIVSNKQTEYGAAQNRLESALDEIATQTDNLTSSRSTLRDADIAEVSSEYIRQQILQQASATLLATANQTPALALQLL